MGEKEIRVSVKQTVITGTIYSFGMSWLIFKFINLIMPIRVSVQDEELGLDASQHNEKYLQGTLLVKNSNGTLTAEEKGIAETLNY